MPRIEGDRLIGRGAYDMKGGLAAMHVRAARPRDLTRASACTSSARPTRSPRTSTTTPPTSSSRDGLTRGLRDHRRADRPATSASRPRACCMVRVAGHGARRPRLHAVAGRQRDPARRSTSSAGSRRCRSRASPREMFDRPSINLGRINARGRRQQGPRHARRWPSTSATCRARTRGRSSSRSARSPTSRSSSTFIRPPAYVSRSNPYVRRCATPSRRAGQAEAAERRPRRRLRRDLVPRGRRPGRRVRPRRRRPPRAGGVGLDPVAGPLPPGAGGLHARRAVARRRARRACAPSKAACVTRPRRTTVRPARAQDVLKARPAAVVVVLLVAGGGRLRSACCRSKLRSIDEVEQAEGGGAIDIPSSPPAEAGKPQTIMILGTDERLGADEAAGEAALGHDHPRAPRRRQGRHHADVDPARPQGRHPGLGLPDKINAAFANGGAQPDGQDGQAACSRRAGPAVQDQPRRPGLLHRLPRAGRLPRLRLRRRRPPLLQRPSAARAATPRSTSTPATRSCAARTRCTTSATATPTTTSSAAPASRTSSARCCASPACASGSTSARASSSPGSPAATRSTDKSLRHKAQLFSLLKLGLGGRQQAGPGRSRSGPARSPDDGSYLTAPPAAIRKTVDDFMNPKVETGKSARPPKKRPSTGHRRRRSAAASTKKRKKVADSWKDTAGMQDVASTGETYAIAQQRKLGFPFYYPSLIPSSVLRRRRRAAALLDPRRAQGLPRLPHRHRRRRAPTASGSSWACRGWSGRTPPSCRVRTTHHRRPAQARGLLGRPQGPARRVAHPNGVYWVSNTLTRTQPYSRMVAAARSLTHLR